MTILYTIHCPSCNVLETKLKQSGIEFEVCDDRETLLAKGFDRMPVLEVDGQIMSFVEAVKWVNERSAT